MTPREIFHLVQHSIDLRLSLTTKASTFHFFRVYFESSEGGLRVEWNVERKHLNFQFMIHSNCCAVMMLIDIWRLCVLYESAQIEDELCAWHREWVLLCLACSCFLLLSCARPCVRGCSLSRIFINIHLIKLNWWRDTTWKHHLIVIVDEKEKNAFKAISFSMEIYGP